MQKHIIPLIAVVLGLVSCQPDVVETEKPEEPRIETPVEEESLVDLDINDWKPGTSGSTDLVEK